MIDLSAVVEVDGFVACADLDLTVAGELGVGGQLGISVDIEEVLGLGDVVVIGLHGGVKHVIAPVVAVRICLARQHLKIIIHRVGGG